MFYNMIVLHFIGSGEAFNGTLSTSLSFPFVQSANNMMCYSTGSYSTINEPSVTDTKGRNLIQVQKNVLIVKLQSLFPQSVFVRR